jgi:hypothetical protein
MFAEIQFFSYATLCVRLDFKPPGEKILSNVKEILKNAEVGA